LKKFFQTGVVSETFAKVLIFGLQSLQN